MSVKNIPIYLKRTTVVILALSTFAVQPGVHAEQKGDERLVEFHGTLRKKPCHVAGGQDINVQFGNIGINRVDGQRYVKPVPYTLTCDEVNKAWSLGLSIKGIPAGFESTALKTSVAGLGIRILQNGKPLQINAVIPVNYQNPPVLQAVPVREEGTVLSEQDFSLTATLVAVYQ
ncbi:fimbrial protein [Pantoea agglomerans]|uniref:fimbrial protein n=1 Tax=Enterobacter agglomerans TaxID=549 RepID=UPI00104F6474|nr:fimbrial protein [Pantoea agglomerans]TCZ22839.1 pilus assembly protein [Pantoea agglomerans]